jgi:hypothetical protein
MGKLVGLMGGYLDHSLCYVNDMLSDIPHLHVNSMDTRTDEQKVIDKLKGSPGPLQYWYKLKGYSRDPDGIWEFDVLLDYIDDSTFYDYSLVKNAMLVVDGRGRTIEVEKMTMDVRCTEPYVSMALGSRHVTMPSGRKTIECKIIIREK